MDPNHKDAIGFPHARRQKFLRFYWHAKAYLKAKVIENKLPHLSGKLTGELVQFTHGAELNAVPLFKCEDQDEQHRFHIAMAAKLSTKLIDAEEAVTIDGLHVVLEGLLLFDGVVKRSGKILGVLEFVCGCPKEHIRTASGLTFSACTYAPPEALQAVLKTRRFPTIAKHMNTVKVQVKFRNIAMVVIKLCRWWPKEEWTDEHRDQYRTALFTFGDKNALQPDVDQALIIIKAESARKLGGVSDRNNHAVDQNELYKRDPLGTRLMSIQSAVEHLTNQIDLMQAGGQSKPRANRLMVARSAGNKEGVASETAVALNKCQAQLGGLELQVSGVQKEIVGLAATAATTELRVTGVERKLEGLAVKIQQVLELMLLRQAPSFEEFSMS